MNADELVKLIKTRPGKKQVTEICNRLASKNDSLHDLIDLTFYADRDLAFRAAWILETLVVNNLICIKEEMPYLISRIGDVQHPSCQRHYAKIMAHLTSSKMPSAISELIAALDIEPVVEKCFDWMINPVVLIAVKVFAAQTLFNLRDRYTWIGPELAEQLIYLMKDGSAAIQSRGKKLLAGL